ncbi:MAG: nuclease-related domain-containing protein, partial [Syntrophorhabdus sp.]
MIIKEMDSKSGEKEQLRELLKGQLSEKQRFLVVRQLRNIEAGERGEKDSAYFVDFYFGKSKNWAVIHDLRIEHNGQVAQIDHLVMNRFMDIYVLETKNFHYGLKITPEGEFLVHDGKKYFAIESPIEQNERHIFLLSKAIDHYNIMPTRLGVVIPPRFVSYVLVSPTSRIIRPSQSKF